MKPGYDVIVKFTVDDKETLQMEAHFQGEKFSPSTVKTHAALQVLSENWNDLVQKINGNFTDADRFRGLKEFALLASSDDAEEKARFNLINDQLQKYEENRGFVKGPRCDQDYIDITNFLLHQLAETRPKLNGPTAAPV